MKKFWVVFAFLLLLSCTQTEKTTEKIKIGAILPLTGPFGFYGEDGRIAIDLALEEAGDKIDVIYEDSAGENPKAVAAFQKLTEVDGAKIVISSTSWISNAVYSQAADKGILQAIIASAAFKRTRNDSRAIRLTVDVKDEAPTLVAHLKQYTRVAILYLNNDYGKGWADQLSKSLGNMVVASEAYNPGETDVSAQLTKIKAANPDVIVLTSTGKDGGLFARKTREMGMTADFVSQRPIQSPELLQETTAVEGLVYSYPAYNAEHPFVAKYKEKYNKEPSVFAVEAYDAVIALSKATEQCKTDTACIYQWFVNKEYDGALGHVTFDEQGDAHYPFVLKQVKDGKFVAYTP